MHSAAGIEDRLFTPARIRLTAWYVSVLAAVLIVLGSALYLVVRQQLLERRRQRGEAGRGPRSRTVGASGHVNVPALSTGPYTVNLVIPSLIPGNLLPTRACVTIGHTSTSHR